MSKNMCSSRKDMFLIRRLQQLYDGFTKRRRKIHTKIRTFASLPVVEISPRGTLGLAINQSPPTRVIRKNKNK